MEIRVISAHGDYIIQPPSDEISVADLCVLNRIPVNSVALYVRGGENAVAKPFAETLKLLSELGKSFSQLIIRPDRNINYESALPKTIDSDVVETDVSSYMFRAATGKAEKGKLLQKGLSDVECREYVHRQVADVVSRFKAELTEQALIVGVSGGGDSNALLGALLAAGVPRSHLHPVMIMGVPDWDKGRSRAAALCESYGLTLKVYEAKDVSRVLGMKGGRDWVDAFEGTYPGVDVEVIGTLAIRRVLSSEAQNLGGGNIVTGLNLEDVLADGLMRVLEGKLPIPFPRRVIDGVSIFYPLYKCPKRILDGCFPKYSLENYEDRYPSHLNGRAIAYCFAQSLNSFIPGLEFDLLSGLEKISTHWSSAELVYNATMDFSTLGPVSLEAQAKWRQYQLGERSSER
jgi:tRNA(Ile)-lysidine synthase TilS/MesJ